jgi:hypothetical protein
MFQVKKVYRHEILWLAQLSTGGTIGQAASLIGYAIFDGDGEWVPGEIYRLKVAAERQAAWLNLQVGEK